MAFLASLGVGVPLFFGLTAASFATTFIGVYAGAAGGLILLAIMSQWLPPAALIPVHTVVMLGANVARTALMWRDVMVKTIWPYCIGTAIGAALGGEVFVSLPTTLLLGILGLFILVVTWMPHLGRIGAERGRFVLLGFGVTFLGVFVSATGSLLAPFVASASPDRRNHVATLGVLMLATHIAKLAAFAAIGFAIARFVPLMAAMIVAGAAGNWVGRHALHRTTEHRFRLLLQLVLTALALRLLWTAAVSAGWL